MSSYNGEKFIIEQVDSILAQNGVDCHLCIRDDGSSDSTLEILESYSSNPRVEIINGDNVGCPNSFLELLKYASQKNGEFDYFAFADQDDYWLPDKLVRATEMLAGLDCSRPRLYCSNLFIVDENLAGNCLMYDEEPILSKSHMLIENVCTGCSMVFDGNLVNLYLKYPVKHCRIHDIWLFHLCMFFGNFFFDMEPYILYRQHRSNVIGANYYRLQRAKSKLKSLRSFWKQHYRENQARLILDTYGEDLSLEDRELVRTVAEYRENVKYRLALLRPDRFRMRRKTDNFWFKVRVLLGAV